MRLLSAGFLFAALTCAQTRITLPIEVVGEDGTVASAEFTLSADSAAQARTLWMQIHNLAYPDMVSVRLNSGPWIALNNNTVAVAEPGKSYGGIGGGFSTLKLTLPLPAGALTAGPNTLHFRFNRSNGLASGFRVLALDLLGEQAQSLLQPGAFQHDDPASWTPPLRDPAAIAAGKALWYSAALTVGGFGNSAKIRARCADCHAADGRDLKYFNYSNASIAVRSRFHGLSEQQGQQIASYIRSLDVPSPGRPWNPPYQPGPGLDAQPVSHWSAGAGLQWALDRDSASLPFVFGAGGSGQPPRPGEPDWSALLPRITREAFRPDATLNAREIPISLQLPDWNHWLPQIHPLDAWGDAFTRSEFAGAPRSLHTTLSAPDAAAQIASGKVSAAFDRWLQARRAFLRPYLEARTVNWTPELGVKAYATELWQLVKTWELTQESGLEGMGPGRTWFNSIPAATAPTAVNIPSGPSGMGGSALTNEYFDSSWYALQMILNSGNHRHRDRTPVDWIYVVGRFLDLQRESKLPEPARVLVSVIQAMQSTDPKIGPEDRAQGWRLGASVDPTIMVSDVWKPVFAGWPAEVKRAVTESMLAAWLDKSAGYNLGRYFRPGVTDVAYAAPGEYGDIFSGKVWEKSAAFRAAGVNPELVSRLEKWGAAWVDMAARFSYGKK